MSLRSVRRAMERKTVKLARKAAASGAPTGTMSLDTTPPDPMEIPEPTLPEFPEYPEPFEPPPLESPVESPRLAANRANAQLSTGPRTPEGKSKVSLNAVKTALTGRTVLLAADDATAYEQHILAFQKEYNPASPEESALVQSLADIRWRLQRILSLEMTLYAKGALQFADSFNHRPAAERAQFIELETFLVYEKQLRNLQIQEGRLARRREKELAELRELQAKRRREEQKQLQIAAQLYLAAKAKSKPFSPAAHGFEFSTSDIKRYLDRNPSPRPVLGRPAAA